MKSFCAILLIGSSLLLLGCSGHDSFDAKLRSIKAGTDARQVEGLLGKPTVVFTRSSYWGTWLVGAAQWWAYEEATHDGEVWFNERGQVCYVCNRSGRVIPPQ